MRTIALFAWLLAAVAPLSAQDRITVDQLEQRLAAEHNRNDWQIAHRLENLQLIERISTTRLEKLEAALPGPDSRAALLAVADLSALLDLPQGEIPHDPPPTAEEQQILASAHDASAPSAGQAPDFDTTANITRFRNLKYIGADPGDPTCRLCTLWPEMTEGATPIPVVVPVPLLLSRGSEAVAHREGHIVEVQTSHAWAPTDAVKTGIEDWQSLHTLMSNVLHDMRAARPVWAHWEQGTAGKLAVFRFSVSPTHAAFPVRTLMDPESKRGFAGNPGYQAEIALDPATGAVYRLVLRAKLDPGLHVSRADIVVRFGSVTVAGNAFLAPLSAVSIAVSQSLVGFANTTTLGHAGILANQEIRPVMHLLDIQFTDYRPGLSNAAAAVRDPAFLAAAIRVQKERVTVDQLEKIIAGLLGSSDQDVAHRLEQLELTQRLTPARYGRMRHRLPGKASADALMALYDLSEFDELASPDTPQAPAPDAATEGKIISTAVEFVARTTRKMPDLFATRQLARFEDLQVIHGLPQPLVADVKPLIIVDQSTGTVHFREGQEVVESASKGAGARSLGMGLDTWGIFGPILEIVMTDVLNSKIGWSHWEDGPSGPLAVFRYAVPQAASHYNVRFCCYLADDGLPSSFAATPGYHGELAIDPNTGSVLRLVLKVDFKTDPARQIDQERNPLLRNDVLVEYGPVDIAGKQYICPVRTASVMTSWTLGRQGPLKRPMPGGEGPKVAKKALAIMEFSRVNSINEAAFSNYHVFRSEMRIVSDPGDPASTPQN